MSDPEKFGRCLPELENIEVLDSKAFKVTVKVGILFIRGKLKLDFAPPEQTPPSHTKFEGEGRGAGISVKLVVNVDLVEKDGGSATDLVWVADATLGGLLSEISQSLVENTTRKFTKQFFECIKTKLESSS